MIRPVPNLRIPSLSTLARPAARVLASLVLALLAPTHAQAQSVSTPRFEDSMAQRMQACSACHGAQGRAAPDGYYPRIAGKPAGYLFNQLLHFRDGRRHYGLMARMTDPLSDAYLWEIAQYFAGLELPYPPPSPIQASAATLERGRTLALQGDAARGVPACAACHGQKLTGVQPNIPGLLGVPRDYINSQLGAWRAGERRAHGPDCMAQIVQRLGDDDVSAVSAWIASQPVPADPHAAPTLPAALPMSCGSARLPTPSQASQASPARPSTGVASASATPSLMPSTTPSATTSGRQP
jgi:cytochrome c553